MMAERPRNSRDPRGDDLWRKRFPDDVTCIRCLEVRPLDELDRLLWCESCRAEAQRRAKEWGWVAGGVIAAGLAVWIWVAVQPSDIIIGGWIATVVAALWLGAKVARELFYGIMRFRNRRAVEAVPPENPPDIAPDARE